MKLPSLLTWSVVPLAGLLGTAVATDAVCWRNKQLLSTQWEIFIPVPQEEIPGICGGLWDNLKGHALCTVFKPNSCEPFQDEDDDGNIIDGLLWSFYAIPGCNEGMIESAFWEATKNRFGGIECNYD